MNKHARLSEKIRTLEAQQEETLKKAHELCQHPVAHIIEGHYSPSSFGGAISPFRVCTLCGYAEEGWGCGYWKLGPESYSVREMHPDAAEKFVLKFYSQADMSMMRYKR